MKSKKIISSGVAAFLAVMTFSASAWAATTVQVGASGKTYATSVVQCTADPTTGEQLPVIDAGLFNPTNKASATVSLNGAPVAAVTADNPAAKVWRRW